MKIVHKALVVVADGRKMLFFRNKGDAEFPNLVVEYGEEQPNPADRDQKSDAQGQRPSGASPGQNSTAETDYHRQAEDAFAAHAADELKSRALRNEFEELIIIAAPKVLGEMRKHYHKEVSSRLKAEISKDLTGHPPGKIEAILKDHG